MKIALFELRPDETSAYEQAVQSLSSDTAIAAFTEPLSSYNVDALSGYDAVVINNKSLIDAALIERMSELGVRALAIRCIGFNHVDIQAAHKAGIRVCNTPYPPYGVAEFTVMLILMALRHGKAAIWRQQVNDYSLDGLMGKELRTLTVGVMGTGRIGQAVIKNLSGFGCKILAYDPYANPNVLAELGATCTDLDTLLTQSDLITVHMPLMDSTYHIIDADAIKKMRDGVTLINVSRGELMDTEALIEGIETEKIGSLAMDVFENESGIYHENRMNDILTNRNMAYLRQFRNVILTNHIAFYTDIDVSCMVEQGIAGARALLSGTCETEIH